MLLGVPGGALGIALLLEVCDLLEIDDLEGPRESVSSTAHYGQTHVLEKVIDMLRPPVQVVTISRGKTSNTGEDARPERKIPRVARVQRGRHFGVPRPKPCCGTIGFCEGGLGRLRKTHLVSEEVRRDPVGGDLQSVPVVGGNLRHVG